MTTVSVNWELAPEGTTHYMPENDDFHSSWLKRDAFGWQIWYHLGGCWHNGSWNLNKYLDTFIIKPVKEDRKVVWDGNGLPPVGTVCEAAIPHTSGPDNERSFIWIKGRVIAYHEIKGKTYAWFAEEDGFYPPNVLEFRPIRTPEQIAEEERQKAIEEMMHLMPPGDINSVITKGLYSVLKQVMIGLYDAGYRKEHK